MACSRNVFGSLEGQHGRPFPFECSLVAPEAPGGDEKGSIPHAQQPSPRPGCPVCRRVTPLHHLLTRGEKEVNGEEIIN